MEYQVINISQKFEKYPGGKLEITSVEKKIIITESGKPIHFIIHSDGKLETLGSFELPILVDDFTSVLKIINDISLETFGVKAHLKFN